ncbi:helix-turn-helix domain-containing protein [Salisediminibacterium beveridgei]|uniref:Helicase Helix-turn-helix domain-containing protein n=1 Tax=Salisediminibacterium beveridgei TaxID=632773 RepID=A0A1D7QUT3_9BACI|nr:helix-turn-helix domain-containing protein [Salisediminibacterium beveridgei]AOM82772.1 hypothetical protein BBEV_1409 [Salisediminibacterium beveridgei]
MNFEQNIMTYLHECIGFDRSTKAIMHILLGKRSAQTIQDIHLFQVENLGGLLKFAPEYLCKTFEQKFQAYRKRQEMFRNRAGENTGLNPLLSNKIHGMRNEWTGQAQFFFEGVALTVQSCSFLKAGESYFFPVSENEVIQHKVKRLLKSGGDIHDVTSQLYVELNMALTFVTDIDVTPFVLKLTAKNEVGYTYSQLADMYQLTELEMYIRIRMTLHAVLDEITSSPRDYPLLKMLLTDDQSETRLFTATAMKTKELLEKGRSLEEIANVRRLKMSTVEDHLAELAFADDTFDYRPYLTEDDLSHLCQVIKKTNATKLRQLRDETMEQYSYLQLRIAMALSRGRSIES